MCLTSHFRETCFEQGERKLKAACSTRTKHHPSAPDGIYFWVIGATLWLAGFSPQAFALPTAPVVFCETYSDTLACSGQMIDCTQCHQGPPTLNVYGTSVKEALNDFSGYGLSSFDAFLPDALWQIETLDSDQDGATNLLEIENGTFPGDNAHFPILDDEPGVSEGGLPNPYYLLGEYDPVFAFRRVGILYCGQTPSFDEMEAFKASTNQTTELHEKLATCLDSEYWKEEALHRLADKRIRPLKAVGREGDIILADYDWDYRLFSYALSDDNDARDLLLADYHVDEDGERVYGTIGRVPGSLLGTPIRVGSGQPLQSERRAGMITTQWFLVSNTMFTPLPRTTAAQAYRSYLGFDIAKHEGIMPVSQEPRDVDNKGVDAPQCASCHSTLDPLSYAFADYNGIEIALFSNPSGRYDPNRSSWGGDSVVLNSEVNNLVEWAEVAANSEPFKVNIARMFFEHALHREPNAQEQETFQGLWNGMEDTNYSANEVIHDLVDSDAFGAP